MLFQEITDILEEVTQRVVTECFMDIEVFRLEDLEDVNTDSSELVRIVGDSLSLVYQKKLSEYFSSFGANLLIISLANEFLSETADLMDYGLVYECDECDCDYDEEPVVAEE